MFLYKRGRHWYIGYSENGKQRGRPLHKYLNLKFPVTDRFTAQNLLANLRMKEIHGELGIPDDFGSLTIDDFYRRYLRYCDRNKAPNTVKSDKERLGKWIKFLKAQKIDKVAQITLSAFRSFSEHELKDNANSTRNRYASIVRASFNWGIQEEYLKGNPLKNVIRLKEVRSPWTASFREGDLEKLFSINDKEFVAYLKLIYYTLMRRSEALNLTWSDIDFRQRLVRVTKTKGGAPRTIPLSQPAVDSLMELAKIHNATKLFPYSENAVTKTFQRLRKKLKLEITGIHHFRHLGASELLRRGANPRAVQELLGHSTMRTTMEIYAHVSAEGLRETVSKL